MRKNSLDEDIQVIPIYQGDYDESKAEIVGGIVTPINALSSPRNAR